MLFSNRDIKSYITDITQTFKNIVLGGNPHDPVTLELARMQGMERGLIEGEINLIANRLAGDLNGASCEEIERRGALLNIPRRGATSSKGVAFLNGINGSVIPSNLSFNIQGKTFILDVNGDYLPLTLGIGSTKISIISVDAGDDVNLSGDGYLDFNINGIQSLVKDIFVSGGVNEEGCKTEYLNRVLYGESLKAPIGSRDWYIQRALRYPSVKNAIVSSCNCCATDIDIYIFAHGFINNIPSQDFLDKMQERVFDADLGVSEYGSKLFGANAYVKAATLSPLKIYVKDSGNVSLNSRALILSELSEYVQSFGVGGNYCKNDFISIIHAIGGCTGGMSFEYTLEHFEETETYLLAKCDISPYIIEVVYVC